MKCCREKSIFDVIILANYDWVSMSMCWRGVFTATRQLLSFAVVQLLCSHFVLGFLCYSFYWHFAFLHFWVNEWVGVSWPTCLLNVHVPSVLASLHGWFWLLMYGSVLVCKAIISHCLFFTAFVLGSHTRVYFIKFVFFPHLSAIFCYCLQCCYSAFAICLAVYPKRSCHKQTNVKVCSHSLQSALRMTCSHRLLLENCSKFYLIIVTVAFAMKRRVPQNEQLMSKEKQILAQL